MPRPRKTQKTETPEMAHIEVTPVLGEPGVFEVERESTEPTENQPDNVIEFRQQPQDIGSSRDWSNVDSILANVVQFI